MIIFNFDVLALPGPTLGARQPNQSGRALWDLFWQYQLGHHTCVVADERFDRSLFETWMLRENIKASMYDFLDTSDPVVKAEKVHLLTTTFGRAGWYVDTDPRTCALTIAKGIPTLVVGSPYTIRPEWESEKVIKPWDDLVAEMDRQTLKKRERTWGELHDDEAES